MCRISSELFIAAGGSGIIATVTTFAKAHWDAIKDRKAFKAAKKRDRHGEKPTSDVKGFSDSD